nr:hypothetical protein [Tanacetum cinerariifolium]
MLALTSASARHSAIPRKSHGIKNLPGSPNFSGSFFRRTAEQCSFNGVRAISLNFSLFLIKAFRVEATFGAVAGEAVVVSSDEELEAPIEDQSLPTDALPTALLPGYIDDSNLEEDEEDPKEDPVDYPANGGDNDDNESSDDDDDDDVEKDGEVNEKEEHLAPTDPFVVSTIDPVPSS